MLVLFAIAVVHNSFPVVTAICLTAVALQSLHRDKTEVMNGIHRAGMPLVSPPAAAACLCTSLPASACLPAQLPDSLLLLLIMLPRPSAKTSVDLFNRPISLVRLVQSALNPRDSASRCSGRDRDRDRDRVTLVRLAPPLLVALRRMQRLMQVCV